MTDPDATTSGSNTRIRIGAALAIAVVAAFGIWIVVQARDDDGSSSTTTAATNPAGQTPPVAVSADGLATLAGAVEQPIYWAGPQQTELYELTRLQDGKVYVRYLPDGVDAGAKALLLTVATYPLANAYGTTQRASRQAGATPVSAGAGAVAFQGKGSSSVYLAFQGVNAQIEVFSPTAGEAAQLVESGQIVRAG
jgi:hypothetical protein